MYLIVTRSFPPEVGGMQNLMWGLTYSLSKYNLVKVFADYHEKYKEHDDKVSFSIDRVGGVKLFRKHRKAYLANDYVKKMNSVSCVIADHWKSLELIKTSKKKICLIHSKEINHKKGSFANRRILKAFNNIDQVVANSEYTKNLAVEIGIDKNKVLVINPGVFPAKDIDKSLIKESENLLKNKNPRLITVSRFDKRKNHEKVIMTVRNLKEKFPNIKYLCIGYGEEENNLKKLVKQLKIEEVVIFKKNISLDLKSAFLLQSDLFIMPSIIYKKSVEGFGISFIEAAQQGTPSIGGKDGGAADSILHEETGLICDGNDLNSIYESVLKILENNKYKIYGKNAKEFSKQFDWDKIVNEYLKIL